MKRLYLAAIMACLFAIQGTVAQTNGRLAPKLAALYQRADSLCAQKAVKGSKPVIGITTTLKKNSLAVGYDYVRAVTMAGGTPYLIASTDDPQELATVVRMLDGLLMTSAIHSWAR